MTSLILDKIKPTFLPSQKVEISNLWGANIQFNKGEFVQIIAPSGTGKTSLIHMLYGLRSDFLGSVKYDDRLSTTLNADDYANLRKSEMSIVFQDLKLFSDKTVQKNIEIKTMLAPYHNHDQITAMCQKLGIESLLDRNCGSCSYGEQQRVAIIRALQQPFDFLLLDEPFSHLDDNNRIKALELIIKEATHRNATIILADLRSTPNFPATRTMYL